MQTTHQHAIGLRVALDHERTRLLTEGAIRWNRHYTKDDRRRRFVTDSLMTKFSHLVTGW